jgi:uncharacterized repeat protein (TIGR03803 family)
MNFASTCSFNRLLTLFVLALAGLFVVSADAQTYTKLYTWPEDTRNDTGVGLAGLMTQGRDGNIYGTVGDDNTNAAGSAFKMTPSGTFTRIYSFCTLTKCADGSQPWGGLTLGKDGNLYGTTMWGGSDSSGTVFKLTPGGALTTVWDFDNGPDGAAPWYPPLQSLVDGDFYGVSNTQYSGHYGAFYKLVPTQTPPYKESVPINFNYTDGNDPNLPTQGTDGNFYGSTLSGGTKGLGLVYKTTSAGVQTIFHNFTGYATTNADGSYPIGVMVQGNDGAYYGVTWQGGASNLGTIFKVTSNGTYTLLHSFTGHPDGAYPRSGLILGSDGNFYGTTLNGGTANDGAIYRVTPAGQVTVLYNLCSQTGCADGFSPVIPLLQHTNGKFYGSTSGNSLGGSYFYSLDMGLAPFVKMVNWGGKVGNTVELLGQGFTGTTGVSFNGVAGTFNNVSDTYMTVTVPAGALTGTVTVTTFTGSMASNRAFLVLPTITSFSPKSGTVGSKVTITGISLTQTVRVTIGGKSASFTVNSDTQVTATVPPGAVSGKITITTAGGVASAGTFQVVPLITSFSPTSGPVGTSVTINGNSFTGTTQITFGGVAATSYAVISDKQVDALVPSGGVTGPICVTTPGGTGCSTSNFTVTH